MDDVALFFHLLGALLFVAGIVLAGVCFEVARRRERPVEIALLLGLTRIGVVLVGAGAVLLLGFGLWLVHLGHFGYGTGWVDAAIRRMRTARSSRRGSPRRDRTLKGLSLALWALTTLSGDSATLKGLSLALWALTILWLPLLLLAEALRPRLHYDVRRWSTVFPVGMYAACSFVVGTAVHAPAITGFARVWVWVSVAVWLVVFVSMLRRGPEIVRRQHPSIGPDRIGEIAPSRHSIA